MKRTFDIAAAAIGALALCIPIALLAVLVRATSPGPALYWSRRVGRNNRPFLMPKFRTMRVDAPDVASHLLTNPESYLTPIGSFLRTSSLDELPQLWSVLRGDMSLVGPRPALHNQRDLIELRTRLGVSGLRPGITGWAQINGRDALSTLEKVEFDAAYLERRSLHFDVLIILRTLSSVALRQGVSH